MLSNFCYGCDKIDHTESAYDERGKATAEEAHEKRRYGPWMRVRLGNGPQQKLFFGSRNSAELLEKDTRIEDRLISTMKDK